MATRACFVSRCRVRRALVAGLTLLFPSACGTDENAARRSDLDGGAAGDASRAGAPGSGGDGGTVGDASAGGIVGAGGSGGSGTGGAGSGGVPMDGGSSACRPLSLRDDAYAFEVRITSTAGFYKLDFPREQMPHCVGQKNDAGTTDPELLATQCEASYLFKKDASSTPAAPIVETFDVVIAFVPPEGMDLTIARGGSGTTQYEIRGLDGRTWLTFDDSQSSVHLSRDAMTPGGLASRIPATPVVGPKRGAYLFPWYGTPEGPAGRWVHWDPDDPELYTPERGFYDSADPAVVAEQMAEARSAGLDLFVVSYWDTENPPLATILDAAEDAGIEISAMLETATRSAGSPRESVRDQLALLVDTFGSHPAWIKADGKPIVFVYDRVTSDIDAAPVGASGWNDWLWISEDLGDRMPVLMFPLGSQWAEEGAALFGGAFAFAANSGGGSYYTGSHGDDWAWAWTARQAGALLAIPILPSINRLREPADAPNYRNQWHAARAVMPDMIVVNSWNEYHESTIIEPTTAFGSSYLDLTREEGALYCAGELGALIEE